MKIEKLREKLIEVAKVRNSITWVIDEEEYFIDFSSQFYRFNVHISEIYENCFFIHCHIIDNAKGFVELEIIIPIEAPTKIAQQIGLIERTINKMI